MTSRDECKDYIRCPRCGSVFVDWWPEVKRWRCPERSCGWVDETESSPGCYNYATGSCFYGYDPAKGHRPGKQLGR